MSRIIIGDVHGCYDTLLALVEKLPHRDITFCGDLIDRGPHSRKVIDYVRDNNFDCVKGNHEDLMEHPRNKTVWMLNGGAKALINYRNDDGFDEKALEIDRKWISELPVCIIYDKIMNDKGQKLMVSHSMAYYAFRDQDKLSEEQFEGNIMWDRDFNNLKPIDGIFNVFGHTPQDFGPKITDFYACIDTGAVYTEEPDHKPNPNGFLTALEFPSMKIYTQETLDKGV